jgi:hypothetical protein
MVCGQRGFLRQTAARRRHKPELLRQLPEFPGGLPESFGQLPELLRQLPALRWHTPERLGGLPELLRQLPEWFRHVPNRSGTRRNSPAVCPNSAGTRRRFADNCRSFPEVCRNHSGSPPNRSDNRRNDSGTPKTFKNPCFCLVLPKIPARCRCGAAEGSSPRCNRG